MTTFMQRSPSPSKPSGPSGRNAGNARGAANTSAGTAKALQAKWAALQPRERVILATCAGVLAIALIWLVALAPALNVIRTAPAQIDHLQNQQQLMTQMARDAALLREHARSGPADARGALADTTRNVLGTRAQVTGTGDQAQVRIEQVQPAELLDWLAQVRSNALTTPSEVDLAANPQGLWTGTATFALPPPG